MSAATAVIEHEDGSTLVRVSDFDTMDAADAHELVRQCCASRRWAVEVVSGRPYTSMRCLVGASGDVVADLSSSELGVALAGLDLHLTEGSAAEREATRERLRELVRLRLVTVFR